MSDRRKPPVRSRARLATRKPLRSTLERRGRALLIVGGVLIIAAYALPRSELLYAGGLLFGLPLVALIFVRFRRHRMAVARRFSPAVAEAGGRVAVKVEVRNLAAQRTGEATWRDEWPWFPFGTDAARLKPLARNKGTLGVASAETVDYVFDPPRRGVFDIGPLVVEVADPFQLARGEIVVGATQKLVVTPHVARLPFTGTSIAADDGSARALQRRNSVGGDDLMTREYRDGDPLRRVHWKATARHGELMVRLEEQRSHAQARIILDTRRAGYRDAVPATDDQPESDSFEWAVAFTASLAFHLHETGFSVDVIETGFRQLTSPEHQEEFLESLAAIELVDGAQLTRLPAGNADPGHSLGSAFAIVADAESHTVARLKAQRAQFDSALAFIVNPHSETVIAPLREAGWACVAVRPTDDLAAVWLAAEEIREASRARG
ncbi:MAG TPA: DUF58 domain-containing protein [Terrimesophilobacter sp.]|nr:DUF58 domain-containing protein [Terrimesophilobacter sp.]